MSADQKLFFLKLGGSLITEKNTTRSPRPLVINRLAAEIASTRSTHPELRLVLGHGSGSFGHVVAKKHNTRQGVNGPRAWLGFVDVWYEASALNRIIMDALWTASIPAVAFPPSASVYTRSGQVLSWNLQPIKAALEAGLVPVVYGDVVFDEVLGGTILSTEDLFTHLAQQLYPVRILLAGIEPGVWKDYPECTQLLTNLTPAKFTLQSPSLSGSAATDVTGGMADKVRQCLSLVEKLSKTQVLIFSGEQVGNVAAVLAGEITGTLIKSDD